jgi:hypothetical protein
MNHKYGKPRSARAGCKLCKPYKKDRRCANKKEHLTKAQRIVRINDKEVL